MSAPQHQAASPVDRLLQAVAVETGRQREAILARDAAGVRRSFDALAALLVGLQEAMEEAGGAGSARAARLRAQLRLNQTLLLNGMAAADHWVGCVAAASPAPGAVLFSGVG